jgi:molybdopterin converting factor small subunit
MQVEFLGFPRLRAGVPKLEIQAETLGELLAKLSVDLPALAEFIGKDQLSAVALANLNGDRFINDPLTPLAPTDCVLILSADAGG